MDRTEFEHIMEKVSDGTANSEEKNKLLDVYIRDHFRILQEKNMDVFKNDIDRDRTNYILHKFITGEITTDERNLVLYKFVTKHIDIIVSKLNQDIKKMTGV